MGSEYKGDSPGKKVSRLRTWMQLRKIHRALNLPYHGALVLGGHGGDIATLKGLNFEPESITAIDLDPFWVEWCQHEHPEIQSICGEAGAVSKDVRYNMAHLDFCGGLSADNILTVADVVENTWTHPTVLAVTMLKGREHLGSPTSKIMRGIDRRTRRELLKIAKEEKCPYGQVLLAGMTCSCGHRTKKMSLGDECSNCGSKLGYFEPMKMVDIGEAELQERLAKGFGPSTGSGGLHPGRFDFTERPVGKDTLEGYIETFIERGYIKKNGKLGAVGTAVSRAEALQYMVDWLVWARDTKTYGDPYNFDPVGLRLLGTLGYHSRIKSKKKGGTPFMTAFYLVRRQSQDTAIMMEMAACLGRGIRVGAFFHSMDISQSTSALEPTAAELAKVLPNEKVAKMLAVETRSIGAWKAHHSRGTYETEPVVQMAEGISSIDPFFRCDVDDPIGVMDDLRAKNLATFDLDGLSPQALGEAAREKNAKTFQQMFEEIGEYQGYAPQVWGDLPPRLKKGVSGPDANDPCECVKCRPDLYHSHGSEVITHQERRNGGRGKGLTQDLVQDPDGSWRRIVSSADRDTATQKILQAEQYLTGKVKEMSVTYKVPPPPGDPRWPKYREALTRMEGYRARLTKIQEAILKAAKNFEGVERGAGNRDDKDTLEG